MVSTTARIAGRLATSPSLAVVATELNNLHLFIDADMRLAAAAGGVARYLADEAGLECDALTRLESAVIAACKEAFKHLTGEHPHLKVVFTLLPDRLEVVLSHEGNATPPVGVGAIRGSDPPRGRDSLNPGALAGVDRVQYEEHGDELVTRLTKFLGKVAPKI